MACTGIIYAATTVGNNISTGGTLDVSGASTFSTASSTGIVKFGQINSDTGSISFGDENLYTTGNIGIGTSSPYAKLSVVGEIVGSYFTATSTTATSTFANGIYITSGCFRGANGSCITSGGSTTTIDGMTGGTVSGDVTVSGGISVTGDSLVHGSGIANVDVGASNFGSITTGAQNVAIGGVNAPSLTTGRNNICIGRLGCENITTGNWNQTYGYSMLNIETGDGNVANGSHACTGQWGAEYWGDGDGSFNTCVGHDSGQTNTGYNNFVSYVGEYNTAVGSRTGSTGIMSTSEIPLMNYTTLLGHGASVGVYNWATVTAVANDGANVAEISSTAHGFTAGEFVQFRDAQPDYVISPEITNSCPLADNNANPFKVGVVDNANEFKLSWCRSSNGATNNWQSGTTGKTVTEGAGAANYITFTSDASALVDKAIMFNNPLYGNGTTVKGIVPQVPYWVCDELNDGSAIGNSLLMTLRTRPGTCTGAATTNYVDIIGGTTDDTPYYAGSPNQCSAWNTVNYNASYTSGTFTMDMQYCNFTDNAYAVRVEEGASASAVPTYSFATAIGANSVASCDNCVVLGRPGDKIGVGISSPAVELDVNGLVKVYQTASTTCSGSVIGSMFYNTANDSFWGCKSSGWVKLDN